MTKYFYRDGNENTKYNVFPSDNPKSKRMFSRTTCWQCAGTAFLPHYAHIDGGVCYKCQGDGSHKAQVWTEEKIQKLLANDKIKSEKFSKDQEDRREEILAKQEEEKKQEELAEEKRLAEIENKFAKQEYIGSMGDKIELEVKVVFSKTFDGYYGQSTIYSLEDNKGNSLVYWQSGYGKFPTMEKKEKDGTLLFYSPSEGEKFLIKATVKEHKVYENNFGKTKQTVLARPKNIQDVDKQHWQDIGTWK